MRGPLHFIAEKVGGDLDDEVREIDPDLRFVARSMLKVQIGFLGLVATSETATTFLNHASVGNKLTNIVEAGFIGWVALESVSLHSEIPATHPVIPED